MWVPLLPFPGGGGRRAAGGLRWSSGRYGEVPSPPLGASPEPRQSHFLPILEVFPLMALVTFQPAFAPTKRGARSSGGGCHGHLALFQTPYVFTARLLLPLSQDDPQGHPGPVRVPLLSR